MAVKKYQGKIEIDFEIDIDDSVIDVTQEKEWKDTFYDLSRHKAVKFFIINALKGRDVGEIEGFEHKDNGKVVVVDRTWYMDELKVRVELEDGAKHGWVAVEEDI